MKQRTSNKYCWCGYKCRGKLENHVEGEHHKSKEKDNLTPHKIKLDEK